jgi:LCP family protein required for cell wall assembly
LTALPPDQASGGSGDGGREVPELEPQFRDALRQAAGDTEEHPAPEHGGDHGDTAEYAPGEAPDVGEAAGDGEAPDVAEAPEDPEAPGPTHVLPDGRTEVRRAIAAAGETGRPWAPRRPPLTGDPEPPPRRFRYWLRSLLASFLIVASFAAATATANLLQLTDWVDDIQPIKGVEDRLAEVDGGEPQTFLILGSDKRGGLVGEEERGLSDTTILLRIDPGQNVIAVLNIPRDLKVFVPGIGTTKFNAAYALGGPKLALRTVQRLTAGMGLQINHLVNVDFLGFVRAINEIKCVYVDVDRRYYHSNEGLPASLQYDEINIRPGYQKLCGRDALDYVRYRHTDTDLVRAARQQEFLRLARQRVPPSELFKELTGEGDLVDTFTAHTQSDIQDVETMLDVIKLMIEARSAPIREIHFPAVLGRSYVFASRRAIQGAINKFLGLEASGGPRGALELELQSGTRREGGAGDAGRNRPAKPENAPATPTPESDGLVDAAAISREFAKRAARKLGAEFSIFYPRRLPSGTVWQETEGPLLVENPRLYHLNDEDGHTHEAYRIVMQLPQGDYFGVQGLRGWQDPPILDDPSETRTIRGREFDIYLDADRVRLIGWTEDGNAYWVSNSLLYTLTNDQMLGIARSIGEIVPNPKPRKRGRR